MTAWEAWLVVAGVLAVAEILTLTLVLAMLAGGALAGSVVAALGAPAVVQGVAFVAVSGGLLLTVMPTVRRHRHLPPLLRTGPAALVGTSGVALSQVDRSGGQVRLGGETWTARPYDETLVIPVGEPVDVLAIDGAIAVVHPTTPPGLRSGNGVSS